MALPEDFQSPHVPLVVPLPGIVTPLQLRQSSFRFVCVLCSDFSNFRLVSGGGSSRGFLDPVLKLPALLLLASYELLSNACVMQFQLLCSCLGLLRFLSGGFFFDLCLTRLPALDEEIDDFCDDERVSSKQNQNDVKYKKKKKSRRERSRKGYLGAREEGKN